MKYTQKTRYQNGNVEFYFIFDSNEDNFLNYCSGLKKLKSEIGALSVAIALNNNTIRIIMPFGTNENEFYEKINKILQREYNAFSMFYSYNNPYEPYKGDKFTKTAFDNLFN